MMIRATMNFHLEVIIFLVMKIFLTPLGTSDSKLMDISADYGLWPPQKINK